MRNKKYFTIALWVFITFAACFLFYTAIENGGVIAKGIGFWMGLFSPFATAFVIAYVINFFLKFFEKLLEKGSRPKTPKGRRALALVISYFIAVTIVGLMLLLIIPQLTQSISGLTSRINSEKISAILSDFTAWTHSVLSNNEFLLAQADNLVETANDLVSRAVAFIPGMLPDVVNFLAGLTSGISNLVVGFVASIYMLYDKERLCARIKKTLLAVVKKETADKVIGLTRAVNDTVGNFLSGKVTVSFFIGLIAFIGFTVTGVDLSVLLAVIVGITNVVPFFGPIVGGVLGGFILLLVNPAKLWIYIIIVVILQQLDGNVIGPKVLGKSTGLDPLWIVVSIILGGGLFGFWGMILGVPVFAVIYALLRRWVNWRLEQKGMDTATEDYVKYSGEGIVLVDDDQKPPKKPSLFSRIASFVKSKLRSGKTKK